MSRLTRAAAALALAALVGCSPPTSVSVGVKDLSTDIEFSRADATPVPVVAPPPVTGVPGFPIAPLPPNVVQPGGPVVVALPPDLPPPAPLPNTCPKASPLVAAKNANTPRPGAPPVAASYRYRLSGSFTVTGAHPASGVYPATSVRGIRDVQEIAGGGGYEFFISDDMGMDVGYTVIPEQRAAPQNPVGVGEQPTPVEAGIYVNGFTYRRADGTTLSLRPQPFVMIAKLPLAPGDKWQSKGVDPATGVSVIVNGQTGLGEEFSPSRDRVDACGTVLDATWVEYTVDTTPLTGATADEEPPSSIVGGGLGIQFVGTRLAFANQYGGLPIHEVVRLVGVDGADTVDITREAVILSEPALAAAPS